MVAQQVLQGDGGAHRHEPGRAQAEELLQRHGGARPRQLGQPEQGCQEVPMSSTIGSSPALCPGAAMANSLWTSPRIPRARQQAASPGRTAWRLCSSAVLGNISFTTAWAPCATAKASS
eukprot:1495485-Pyramimonas_sp.AAC.1